MVLLGPIDGVDPSAAAAAWAAFSAVDDPAAEEQARDRAVMEGLCSASDALIQAVETLRTSAAASLQAQDAAWQPLSDRARNVIRLGSAAELANLRAKAAREARVWLQGLAQRVRQARMERFAEAATGVWRDLRQESNVSLESIKLAGTNTRREVRLGLTVDGAPGPQAVLSQGELAAVGLALFLPRSTSEDSPFRFVIIDDPVQSMDPSKVDGLARTLARTAETRQVVVFTHDDRLLQALRRLSLPATTYKLVRGERSAVFVSRVDDPVEQYLRDADALARDRILPPDLVALAVAGYCRDALEEAAMLVVRERLLAEGRQPADIEATLEAVKGTRRLLALALLGDSRETGPALTRALEALDEKAADAVATCVSGVHEPDEERPSGLLADVRRLIKALREDEHGSVS